ncbi:uncharacterized protein LOC114397254 [Glycine soja]|uniref:uncharacterized protein LOC114397254 n=1 Tax=Glycine soja TaxID=3848 RepID=UPI0010398DB3|nr:uncharacterized protein LOC114397254 [Glycine soja]
MPLYTKFMKDILTKKGKYIDNESIVVGGNCSVVIQRKLPKKFKDPGSVTIPYTIGKESVGKALIALGASINLMPLSMCRKISDLKIDPTRMTLQLADRSITRPYEMVEDVLVKVCHFTFPVDFIIMDIEEDTEIPLVLGRPFMLTANCVVNMRNGNLELSIDNQKTLLERALVNKVDCLTSEEEEDLKACLEDLDREDSIPEGEASFEELKSETPSEKKKVELKILLNHLKYVFLEKDETKPVVISNALASE